MSFDFNRLPEKIRDYIEMAAELEGVQIPKNTPTDFRNSDISELELHDTSGARHVVKVLVVIPNLGVINGRTTTHGDGRVERELDVNIRPHRREWVNSKY